MTPTTPPPCGPDSYQTQARRLLENLIGFPGKSWSKRPAPHAAAQPVGAATGGNTLEAMARLPWQNLPAEIRQDFQERILTCQLIAQYPAIWCSSGKR